MVETAAHLVDHVLPPLPLRQWVLSVPKRLRYFLHDDAALQGVVVRSLLRVVERCLREHSPGSSAAARLGAVVFIHRFGSALNAHLHFHCGIVDGVFEPAHATDAAARVVFHEASGLDAVAVATGQAPVRQWVLRACVRRGLLAQCDRDQMAAGRTAAASRSLPQCASRAPTWPGANGCCATAPARRSPSTIYTSTTPNIWSTPSPSRAPTDRAPWC